MLVHLVYCSGICLDSVVYWKYNLYMRDTNLWCCIFKSLFPQNNKYIHSFLRIVPKFIILIFWGCCVYWKQIKMQMMLLQWLRIELYYLLFLKLSLWVLIFTYFALLINDKQMHLIVPLLTYLYNNKQWALMY